MIKSKLINATIYKKLFFAFTILLAFTAKTYPCSNPALHRDLERMRIEPKITFKDVIGLDHAKEALTEIVHYMADPERWDRAGIRPETGYLFSGPARSGKTYIAEALAGEIRAALKNQGRNPEHVSFYAMHASFILKNGFAKAITIAAHSKSPCIFLIDEIDLLTSNKELLHEILLAMGNNSKQPLIIIAVTNRPHSLDSALLRPGKIGKHIRFEYPNMQERLATLQNRLKDTAIDAQAFDLAHLALETEGCSFEGLNALVKTAFQRAHLRGSPIKQADLEYEVDTQVHNSIMDETNNLSAAEREIIAAHQAGHALVAMLLPCESKLAQATIRPVKRLLTEEMLWDGTYEENDRKNDAKYQYGTIFTYHTNTLLDARTKAVNTIMMHLAGALAEEIIVGIQSYSYHNEDKDRALKAAQALVAQGVKIDKLPQKMQNDICDKAFALVSECKTEVMQLLQANKHTLQAIAQALQTKMTLRATDIAHIMTHGALPK